MVGLIELMQMQPQDIIKILPVGYIEKLCMGLFLIVLISVVKHYDEKKIANK